MKRYRALKLYDENAEDLDTKIHNILEAKKKEKDEAETLRQEVVQSVQEEPEEDEFIDMDD
jgi:hypothetical protein